MSAPRRGLRVIQGAGESPAPVAADGLPLLLAVGDVAAVLRCGRDSAYAVLRRLEAAGHAVHTGRRVVAPRDRFLQLLTDGDLALFGLETER